MTTQVLWRLAKLAETGKNERRSYTSPPSDLQKWRLEIIREISKHIWAMGLGEFWIRDLTTRLTSCFTRNANRRIIFRTWAAILPAVWPEDVRRRGNRRYKSLERPRVRELFDKEPPPS